MLQASAGRLPLGARSFLETLAVCSRPVALEAMLRRPVSRGERRLVALLRAARFIRNNVAERMDLSRSIREALMAQVSAEACVIHGQMARTLVARRSTIRAVQHYAGAGDRERAMSRPFAARRATPLAFDRATWLYRQALERTSISPCLSRGWRSSRRRWPADVRGGGWGAWRPPRPPKPSRACGAQRRAAGSS